MARTRASAVRHGLFGRSSRRVRRARWAGRERDGCYRLRREEIIRENFPELSGDLVIDLVLRTSFMSRDEIVAAVRDYERGGTRPSSFYHRRARSSEFRLGHRAVVRSLSACRRASRPGLLHPSCGILGRGERRARGPAGEQGPRRGVAPDHLHRPVVHDRRAQAVAPGDPFRELVHDVRSIFANSAEATGREIQVSRQHVIVCSTTLVPNRVADPSSCAPPIRFSAFRATEATTSLTVSAARVFQQLILALLAAHS